MPTTVSIDNIFKMASESLARDVYRNATWKGVWTNLIPRGEYKSGTGVLQTTFTIGNVYPTIDDENWSTITSGILGTGAGACASSYNKVNVGFDELTYQPEAFNLQGPILCKDDLIYDWKIEQFLPAYIEEITKRAMLSWEKRQESIYSQYATKVYITGASSYSKFSTFGRPYVGDISDVAGSSTHLRGLLPNSTNLILSGVNGQENQRLHLDHLDNIANDLISIGANTPDSNGFISLGEDGPTFSLLIHPLMSKRIVQEDATTGVRSDLRWGNPSDLMKRIGATRVTRNFRHVPNMFPPRFGYAGPVTSVTTTNTSTTITVTASSKKFAGIAPGMKVSGAGVPANTTVVSVDPSYDSLIMSNAANASGTVTITFGDTNASATTRLERIPTWINAAVTTKGVKQVINPNWEAAPIEAAYVLSPRVFTSEIIRPVNSAGSVSWSPTNTMGDWTWVTGGSKIATAMDDPLDKLGCHFAEFRHAPRPEFPQHGVMIIYHR